MSPTLRSSLDELSACTDDANRAFKCLGVIRNQWHATAEDRKATPDEDQQETINVLILTMINYVDSADEEAPKIQSKCLAMLSNLAHDDKKWRAAIIERGGATNAKKAMKAYGSNADVQADACALFCNLTAVNDDGDNRKSVGESGVIPLIVDALNEHRSNPEVAEYASAALSSLALNDKDNSAAIGGCHGVEAVLDTLGRYSGNEEVVNKALHGLNNLTATNKNNRDRLSKRHGTVGTIITACRGHKKNERLQRNGLAVLRRLVENYTASADALARCAGSSVIIGDMESHPNNESIQTHSVALLRRTASTDPRRIEIGLAGGVELVVSAMTTFPEVREVQFQCSAALHNLSIDCEKNADRVGAAGGIAALLMAVKQFESDEKLVDVACRTLHRLSFVGTNKQRLRKEDPTNLLYNVANRYPISCGRTAKGVLKNL